MDAGDILTVNAGSSSVKLGLYRLPESREPELLGVSALPVTTLSPERAMREFLSEYETEVAEVGLVAHRIVHGGDVLTGTVRLTERLGASLDTLRSLAPLHNPIAFDWLRYCRHLFGHDSVQVLVPDTAFFADLPEVARLYALPAALSARHRLRRYGFHGLAHRAMWLDWESTGHRVSPSKVISIQLGAGCSIAAVLDGKPLDTSMGFTPLEGLVMATRSGDVDPGVVTWLQRAESLDTASMERLLNECSGLYGVSGISGDMEALLNNRSEDALKAIRLYTYRIRKYIGAYIAVLGGVDGILFGGGVGENSPEIRERALGDMAWYGIEMDMDRNAELVGMNGRVSTANSRVEVHVVRVDEGVLLAREALNECRFQQSGDT